MQTPEPTPVRGQNRVTSAARKPALGTGKRPPKPRRETFTIGFRVDPYTLTQLEKGAVGYGISVHEYARQRLLELLEKQEEARMLDAVTEARREVKALREQTREYVKEAAILLLANLVDAKNFSPAAIRQGVEDAMLKAEETTNS